MKRTEIINTESVPETVRRVLETWAMMLVERADDNLSCFNPEEPMIVSKVLFKGPSSGFFCVMMQDTFMRALAENLLGDETEDDSSLLLDGAKELANVLSGNLLTELFGTERAYSLDAPSVVIADVKALNTKRIQHLLCFRADECPVALTYHVDE